MFARILQLKNKHLTENGENPRYIIFSRVSHAMFISELNDATAFETVAKSEIFGMKIAVLQQDPKIEREADKYFFEVL